MAYHLRYLIIFIVTLMAAFASFFLKKATQGGGVKSIVFSKYLYIGGFLYVTAALINVWVLTLLPYSVAVPLGAGCYIWTLLISRKFLGEHITQRRVLSIALILIGVVLVCL